MTTDPEPLSALLRHIGAFRQAGRHTPTEYDAALSAWSTFIQHALDEARATPSGDLDLTNAHYSRSRTHGAHTHPGGPGDDCREYVVGACALRSVSADSTAGLDEIADGVRFAGGGGTSDYWRGFNDGIDKLVAALSEPES